MCQCQYCVRATPRMLWNLPRPPRAQTPAAAYTTKHSAWTTRADVVHYIKCADPKSPVRKRCHRCYKKYRNNNSALNRQKKNDLIKKKTRSVTDKKRSIYSNLLCDLCKGIILFIFPFTYLFFIYSFIYLLIYLCIYLFIHLFIYSFIYLFF